MARSLHILPIACALAALSACGVHSQADAPALTGPSTNAKTLTVQVTPDVLTQDGQSQSVVAIKSFGPNGQPLPAVSLRAEIIVGGAVTDFGALSARNLATDASGSATVIYTAPAPVFGAAGAIVAVRISPIDDKDAANTNPVLATIRLVPPGIIGPPTSSLVPDFTAPSPTVGNPTTFVATITGTGADPVALLWDFGDGTTGGSLTTTHTYQSIGTYLVTLRILDSLGRTNSVTHSVTVTQGNLPTAEFSFSPTSPGIHQTINFNAAASTVEAPHNITSYAWDFGDGTTGSGQQTTHSYGVSGNYVVTLQVTDDAGRRSLVNQKTVSVGTNNPSASFTFTPSSPLVGQNITFDASQSSATAGRSISSYAWTFDDGTTGAGVTTSHAYAASGSYVVTLTVTDNAGQTGQTTKTVTVSDQPKPTASFTFSPTSPTIGQSVNFNGAGSTRSSANSPITAYVWIWGDGTPNGSGVQTTHAYAAAGNYTVTLTVTDQAGQTSAPSPQNVSVGTLTPPTASFTFSPTSPIVGQSVSFNGSGSTTSQGRPITAYTWNFGDGATGAGVSATHTYAAAGSYNATLTVVDSGGATNTSSAQTVSVSVATTARIAQPANQSGPAGTPINVNFDGSGSTAASGRSIVSYAWTFSDGGSATGSNPSHSFAAPLGVSTYTATLTVTDNLGGTSTTSVTFTVTGT